jgi:hypothetical protein
MSKGLDEEKINSEIENWKKMKEAGTKKKTGKKLSRKAKAKQETEASTEKVEVKTEEPVSVEENKPEEKSE